MGLGATIDHMHLTGGAHHRIADFELHDAYVTTEHPRIPTVANLCVVDVVVRLPKLMPIDTRVRDARAALRDDHAGGAAPTDQGRLRGTLTRGE